MQIQWAPQQSNRLAYPFPSWLVISFRHVSHVMELVWLLGFGGRGEGVDDLKPLLT